MRVLMADDDPFDRLLLETMLANWGYELVVCSDGNEALREILKPEAPQLAVLDWMMPGLDGPEICRQLRESPDPRPVYIILLTSKSETENIVTGLRAGADDYITKPCVPEELQARVQVGVRILDLQRKLVDREKENARLDVLTQAARALAHHVRNTITPLIGMAEIFDDRGSPEGVRLKRSTLKQGYRVAAIIDALIEMSETRDLPTVAYAGDPTNPMLDMEPLIQRYFEAYADRLSQLSGS